MHFSGVRNGIKAERLQEEQFYDDDEIKNFIIDYKISPYQLSPSWESQHNIYSKVLIGSGKWCSILLSTDILHKIKEELE